MLFSTFNISFIYLSSGSTVVEPIKPWPEGLTSLIYGPVLKTLI